MTRPCPDLDLYLDLEWDLEWDLELDNILIIRMIMMMILIMTTMIMMMLGVIECPEPRCSPAATLSMVPWRTPTRSG